MTTLFSISIALFAGLMLSRPAKQLGLPAVTAYLVAGILIGPYCLGQLGIEGLGFISHESVTALGMFSEVALGFIAFAIGNEFRLAQLRAVGRQATIVAIFQALMATALVDGALIALHFVLGEEKLPLTACIMLGAVATATAPAATLMVVRQYKAKGPVTDILLPVVALDDAVGLVVFAISFGISRAIAEGAISIVGILVEPLVEIVASLALGAVMGYLFNWCEKYFHSNSRRTSMSVTFVILTVALSMLKFEVGGIHIGFSSLLVCMMLGTVFCNICDFSAELMDRVDGWTTPLFVLFFVVSGAELELSVFTDLAIVGIGVVYIVFRSLGKISGAAISARAAGCQDTIVKYLGITLLPQAGVALGMSMKALALPGAGELVRNVTLFSILIYELIGPMATKKALMAAGEIDPEGRVSNRGKSPKHKKNPHHAK
ncbi:MAG: cation:proton antiporter [Butyricicoccus sp.]|nr:cation:proton antiporter [Butyricicoccus sp.]